MSNQPTEGATPEPEQAGTNECMGRYKHIFSWVWEGPPENRIWTNKRECSTCGMLKDTVRFEGQ